MQDNNKRPARSIPKRLFDKVRRSKLGQIRLVSDLFGNIVIGLHGSNDVRVGEFHVRFDPRDRFISRKLIVDGSYEATEIALLCSFIRPGDVVLDIGANIGLYTLAMSRAVGDTGIVIAVEPDPDNLRFLEHNVQANHCSNVVVVPCGLDDHDGVRQLFQVEDNRGYLSFVDLCDTKKAVEVRVRTADSVLRELGVTAPTVAKLDVEGAEPLVLAGLSCSPTYMQLEFVPDQLRAMGVEPLDFLHSLLVRGYSLNLIDRDTAHLSCMEPEALVAMADETGNVYNLMAILR